VLYGLQVVALARKHFNCSSLVGVPLENQKLGMGVHWESRVLGPEVSGTMPTGYFKSHQLVSAPPDPLASQYRSC
jgi:hypothetical protein